MRSETLTRYRLQHGDSHMSVLLDRPNLTRGTVVTLVDSDDPDQYWVVMERQETIERAWVKRDWKNNI